MNLFGLTSAIIFFSSIGFGLTIYASDRQSPMNRSWFVLSTAIALWGLGLYGVTSSGSQSSALLWQYLLDFSAIWVPAAYLYFILKLIKHRLGYLFWFSFAGAVLLSAFSFTLSFKLGVALKYGFYWIEPGPYYILFPIFYTCMIVVSTYFLVYAYVHSKDHVFRAQIRNTFFASMIGFGGGLTNFFPQVINIYPFGNYFVILYLFFMSYGVLRYKLLSAKVISAQIFAGAMVLVFLFNLLESTTSLSDWLLKFVLFVLVGFFSVLLVRGVYQEVTQREKIESLAKQLDSLVHLVSHEVKGALGKNRDAFAAILEGDLGEASEPMKKVVGEANDSTKHTVEMVMDILNSSNAKSGTLTMDKKPFDIKVATEEVVAALLSDAKVKGLELKLEAAEGANYTINGDREKIVQHVIRNLVDNSIRYTPSGSVNVTLSGGMKDRKSVILLSIKDTGVGITPEDMSHLFTEGGRGKDSVKVNVHSTGYGLFFAKNIVDANGGKVWAESQGAGKGSQFYVEFPAVNLKSV